MNSRRKDETDELYKSDLGPENSKFSPSHNKTPLKSVRNLSAVGKNTQRMVKILVGILLVVFLTFLVYSGWLLYDFTVNSPVIDAPFANYNSFFDKNSVVTSKIFIPWPNEKKKSDNSLRKMNLRRYGNTDGVQSLRFFAYSPNFFPEQEFKKSAMVRSLEKNQVPLIVDGLDEQWVDHTQKLMRMEQFIERMDIQDFDIILHVDGLDVMFLCDLDEILVRFLSIGKPLVFSGEKVMFPVRKFMKPGYKILFNQYYFAPPKSEFKYLNSGVYMGYVFAIKNALRKYREDDGSYSWCTLKQGTDQKCMHHFVLTNPFISRIDHEQLLVTSLTQLSEEDFEIRDYNDVRNLLTGRRTCMFHGNGRGRKVYHRIKELVFEHY